MWYARPYMYQIPVETELFKILPTVWDDFQIMEANIGDYASIARKKGDKWFLAAVSANQARNIYVPLDFLDENCHYSVTFYRDCEPGTIEKEETTLEQLKQDGIITEEGLSININASGGEVAIFENKGAFTPFSQEKSSVFNLFPNPAEEYIFIESESFIGENLIVSIFSIEGKLLFSKLLCDVQSVESINISSLASGSYVITVEANGEKESRVLKIRDK